ncbi:842_t:CDS:10 [Ambispora leptoticha]|uniref:Probable glutamate--tRNA ligase, cytoplasmic n=1 Tax=Ambispora leptoticha TaxID=144679 RepID=A0A9N8YWD4_9GLOM|nr:842_t:CDS:10 [Ambispora leptoticha]
MALVKTLNVSKQTSGIPYATIALALYINGLQEISPKISIEWKDANLSTENVELMIENQVITGTSTIIRYLAREHKSLGLYGSNAISAPLIDHWIDFASNILSSRDFKQLESGFDELNHHLTLRTYFVGYKPTLADVVIWGALKNSAVFNRLLKTGKDVGTHLVRWYSYINTLPYIQEAVAWVQQKSVNETKSRSEGPNMNIGLVDAKIGQVVTRFPPEPSGYLHIGHAKAAMLNQYFAQLYRGKLIVRFDDTNPTKEKAEFEESIKEDLALLEIHADQISYTSDHFDELYEYGLKIIQKGLAYVDDTDVVTMREQRMDGIVSKSRDLSVEENLRRFQEMKEGTEFGLTCCLRAKIDMNNPNKSLRDPVIYRCNLLEHHRTGNKWKLYPTYDFACPIVDSIEGVTHALRTNEYHDRNDQYYWILDALELRKVHIWDFSRMNFVYTLLSKRKLQWFVDQKMVSGWDDPRFPTVRGIRRRGLTIEALKQYILMQGASQNDVMLEWDKLWALNKKIIDPIAPRHTSILSDNIVKTKILGGPEKPYEKEIPKHKKNPEIGTKRTTFASNVLLEQEDAKTFEIGEEITLMDWGNAIVKAINKSEENPEIVKSLELQLHLEGDFKKTKKKITWLAETSDIIEVTLLDYDYLINKKKLEEGDEVKDYVTKTTEFRAKAFADANVRHLKKGENIQFERRGYYIVDVEATEDVVTLIRIPDGKATTMASKAADEKSEKIEKKSSKKDEKKKGKNREVDVTSDSQTLSSMPLPPIKISSTPRETTSPVSPTTPTTPYISDIKMYHVPNLYGDLSLPKPEET